MTDSLPSKYTALLLYHKHVSFVKYFFQLFKTFFALSFPRVRDLVILPHSFPFVKWFLEKFENIFSKILLTNLFTYGILIYVDTARWSSGQDVSLSR